ncbi:HBL/NHE enterotoxin family protein [Bacillus cereus]
MFHIKKKFIFLCLTGLVMAQSVLPYHAWADSESLANTLDKTATAILAQHDTFYKNLDGLTTIDNQLKSSLTNHEIQAQHNANYWLDTLNPSTQVVVKDLISYDTTFQSIYKDSIDKFESKNKQETGNTLTKLQNDMNQKQTLVKEELNKLRKFREERLSQNVRDFNADVIQILAKKDGEYAVIESLRKSIAELQAKHDEAQRSYDSIPPDIAGTPQGAYLQSQFLQEMQNVKNEISRENSQLTQFQAEIPVLNTINNQSNTFIQNISESIDTLQDYINSWDVLNAKIKNLIIDVTSSKEIDESYFIAEMEAIKDSWNNILTFTKIKLLSHTSKILKTSWQKNNDRTYYYYGEPDDGTKLEKGEQAFGWQEIKKKWYYFAKTGDGSGSNVEGLMLTGWKNINGKWYYLKSQGDLLHKEISYIFTGYENGIKYGMHIATDGSLISIFGPDGNTRIDPSSEFMNQLQMTEE